MKGVYLSVMVILACLCLTCHAAAATAGQVKTEKSRVSPGSSYYGKKELEQIYRKRVAGKIPYNFGFGEITAVHSFWNRNDSWRRDVPKPELEKFINWRLYKETSKGLMTELACHQLQVGTWALGMLPKKVMGHGSLNYWRDGREVYDNINMIYVFEDGRKMTWGSDIANRFYGLEEQILGSKGTVEPERGKYYFEDFDPAPAFLQLINEWENKLFGSIPFAGTSWAPETANVNNGEYLLGKRPEIDGSSLLTEAFVEACITKKQPERIAEEGYYASLLCLWGHEAIEKGEMLELPEEFMIDYDVYNTKAPKSV